MTHLLDRLSEELPLRWVDMCSGAEPTLRARARIVVSLILEEAHVSGLPWSDIAEYCGVDVRTLERWRASARSDTRRSLHYKRTRVD